MEVGGELGKLIFDLIKKAADSDGIVGTTQNIIMVLFTVGVLLYVLNKKRIKTNDVRSASVCLAIGLLLGILSSFLGIGGGPINLAVLYFFSSINTKTAALNLLYMILFAQTAILPFSFASASLPQIDYITLAVIISSGITGGFAGRRINNKCRQRLLTAVLLYAHCHQCNKRLQSFQIYFLNLRRKP